MEHGDRRGFRRGLPGAWPAVESVLLSTPSRARGTTNSPTDLAFHTLNPFGPCIGKPGQREPGDTVYGRHSQNTGLGIQWKRSWRGRGRIYREY